nr:hypothetical protein NG677_03910 [Methylobacterium sp. OTU13CASTA1]
MSETVDYLAGAEAMRKAILRDLEGFLIEAPTHAENRVVDALAQRTRLIRADALGVRLQPYQVELLRRVETADPDALTERDWSTMTTLRDMGLTTMREHPVWKFVPLVSPYKRRPCLTTAGHEALAQADLA